MAKKKVEKPTTDPTPLTPKQQKETNRKEARERAAANRSVVAASSSWTGKLPATLLNEYAQKQKWERVEYDTKSVGKDQFLTAVTLGWKNPKTNTVEKVRFVPPKELASAQPTSLESRHVSATYVLHRISSHKNLKMMLPYNHRDLWTKMDAQKADTKDPLLKDYLYAANPFEGEKIYKEKVNARNADKDEKRKALESKKEERELRSMMTVSSKSTATPVDAPRLRFNQQFTMSRELRLALEHVIRSNHGFSYDRLVEPTVDEKARTPLLKLGFQQHQVDEAFEYTTSASGAIEWLLIHVPEEDLPKAFANKYTGVSFNNDIALENALRRIKIYGYSEELIREQLVSCKSVSHAVANLTISLVGESSIMDGDSSMENEVWQSDVDSLTGMFECVESEDKTACTVQLKNVTATFYKPTAYPDNLPGIGLVSTTIEVPKYVLLDIVRKAVIYASDTLRGDYMLVALCEWFNENFEDACKSPVKLALISGAVTGDDEVRRPAKKKFKKEKRSHGPLPVNYIIPETKRYSEMIKSRQQLPAWKKQNEIVNLVQSNQVVLITGETGSGKSTQVVQFILDNKPDSHIICTQPRRISAMGLAKRVADERDSELGDQVGYVIRGESRIKDSTAIRFVTAGVLLRILQTDISTLDNISHVVIDEVHERSMDSDFLLILLKRLIKRNKKIKVILMSATVDVQQFRAYFNHQLGHAHIEGRTFPVTEYFLDDIILQTGYDAPLRNLSIEDRDNLSDAVSGISVDDKETSMNRSMVGRVIISMKGAIDYNLVSELVEKLDRESGAGSILIFMSGAGEIDRCIRALGKCNAKLSLLPLHASLSPNDQRKVFNSTPFRKVVVSTNVAETSITIPDVIAVIDSGTSKETVYDAHTNSVQLVEGKISKAAATQRKGRAGRVQEGICYRLYTRKDEAKMIERPAPEMLRSPLAQLFLSVKAMGIADAAKFLSEALDPPPLDALNAAKVELFKCGVLEDVDGNLTAMGRLVSQVPADVKFAKILILSSIFGFTDKGVTMAALLSTRPLRKEVLAKFSSPNVGDVIAGVRIYELWREHNHSSKWLRENDISVSQMMEVQSARKQYQSVLKELGLPDDDHNHDKEHLINSVVSAALAPNLCEVVMPERKFVASSSGTVEQDPESRGIKLFSQKGRVYVHPGSIMFSETKFMGFVSFGAQIMTSKNFVANLVPTTAYGVAFFGRHIGVDLLGEGLIVDEWIGLKCWPRLGLLVKIVQRMFNQMLERKFIDPTSRQNPELMDVIEKLLSQGYKSL